MSPSRDARDAGDAADESTAVGDAGRATRRRASGSRSRPSPATRRALRRTARRYSICEDDAEEALQRGARDPAAQGALRGPARAGPLDPDRGQARGARGPRRARADPRRPRRRSPEPGREDWVAMLPAERRRPGRAGRAPRGGRAQPRGAGDAEAAGAARAEPARRGLLLPRDRRDHRLLGDQGEPLRGRGARALPPLPRPPRGRRPLHRAGAAALRLRRRRGRAPPTSPTLREHLRTCPHCRATLRAYRAAPARRGGARSRSCRRPRRRSSAASTTPTRRSRPGSAAARAPPTRPSAGSPRRAARGAPG